MPEIIQEDKVKLIINKNKRVIGVLFDGVTVIEHEGSDSQYEIRGATGELVAILYRDLPTVKGKGR